MANYALAKIEDTFGYAQPLIAGGTTLTFATGPNRIIRSAGSWLSTHPWQSGMVADVSGTASNDGRFSILSVTALEMEVAEAVVAEGPLSGGERVDGGFRPVFSVVRDGVFVDGPTEIDIPGSGAGGTPGAGVYQWERDTDPAAEGRFTTYVGPAGIVLCLIVGHQVLESTDDGATWAVALSLDTAAADSDKPCAPFTWITGSDGKVYLCTAKQSRGENLLRVARRDDSGWVTDAIANAVDGGDHELFAWKSLLFLGARYSSGNTAYTYDPVTRSLTSLGGFPSVTPGTPQSFFFNIGQRLFRVNAQSSGIGVCFATIVCDVQANYTDGQTFTLTDNFRPPRSVTFEFDVAGDGVTPGNVQVDISGAVTAEDVEAAIIAAVDAQNAAGNLLIDALNGGAGIARLNQVAQGSGGNGPIPTTGSPPGTFNDFAGGTTGTMFLVEWQFGTWQAAAEPDLLPQLNTNNATIQRSNVTFKLDDDSVLVFGQGDSTGLGTPTQDGLECWRIYLDGSTPTVERKTLSVVPVALRYPTSVGSPLHYLLAGYTDNTDPANPRRILWFYPNSSLRDLQWTKLELDAVDPANNPMTVLDTTQIVDGWALPSAYVADGHQIWSPGGDFAVQILEHVRDANGLRIKYRVADDPGNANKTIRFFNDDILGRPGVNGQCTLVGGSAVGGGTVVGNEVQNVDADPSITHEVVWDMLADGVVDASYPHVQAVATRP